MTLVTDPVGDPEPTAPTEPTEPTEPAAPTEPTEDPKPIEYTDFALPEGVEADEQFLGSFAEVAKGLELPQEQAQKLVDLYTGELKRQVQAVEAQVKTWEEEVKKDPQHEETLALAKKALSKFAVPGMDEITANPLFGSNPAVVKFLSSIGRAIKEDSFLESGDGAPNTKTHAERIYGSST